MIKKLKQTLIIIAVIGAVIDGGYTAWCKFGPDIATSKIVKDLGGE